MNLNETELIEGFFRGELSEEQKENFDRKMEEDSLFRQKVIEERQLFDSIDPEAWSYISALENAEVKDYEALLASPGAQELKTILESSKDKFNETRTSSSRKWYLYASAAVIALCISVFAWMNGNPTSQDLYEQNMNFGDLPSLVERGESPDNSLVIGQQEFESQNYEQALITFKKAYDDGNENATLLLYKGISEMELNRYSAAKATFNQLIESDQLDASKGYWYKALLELKNKNIVEAKIELEKIVDQNYYNAKKAEILLKNLD